MQTVKIELTYHTELLRANHRRTPEKTLPLPLALRCAAPAALCLPRLPYGRVAWEMTYTRKPDVAAT
ncbi:hypothetical protein MRX96_020492 [Rhipicephalus microplus]